MAAQINIKQIKNGSDIADQVTFVKDNLNGQISYDKQNNKIVFNTDIEIAATNESDNNSVVTKNYVDTQISDLKGTASTNADTLGELEDKINNLDKVTATSDITATNKTTKIGTVKVGSVTTQFNVDLSPLAPLSSPTFTGTPKAPTATAGTNTTQIATTAFVTNAKNSLLGSVNSNLNTLQKIAAAINNDKDFYSTVNTAINGKLSASDITVTEGDSAGTVVGSVKISNGATKTFRVNLSSYAPLSSPALEDSPTAPTQDSNDDSGKIATTAFVARAIRNLVGTSPATLDTLAELAAAVNNDENFATTISEQISGKQPLHAALTSISGLTTSANKMIYTTAANAYATTTLSAFARTILDDTSAAAVRTTIGALAATDTIANATNAVTAENCTGNAATATNATNDADGNLISSTYVKVTNLHNMSFVSNLGWTTAAEGQKIGTSLNSLAYWNGQYKSGSSNLQYCDQGRFGDIVTHAASDFLTPAQGNAAYKPIDYEPNLSGYLLSSTAATTYLGIHATADNAVNASYSDAAGEAASCSGNSATATRLKDSKTIGLTDATGTNAGTGASFNGSADITLKLPATIKAALTGNASTATTLKTARNIKISDNDGTNTEANGTNFNGSADIVLKLPATIKASLKGNADSATTAAACTGNAATATSADTAAACTGNSATATKLKDSVNLTISSSDGSGKGTASSFDGSAATNIRLPATIKAALTGNATTATTLQTARTINGLKFNGSANICNYAECSTTAATVNKVADITGLAEGQFVLAKGARVTVKFSVTNTAASPALNVHGTGAKTIMYRGYALAPEALQEGSVYDFVYDGTYWLVVGPVFWTIE